MIVEADSGDLLRRGLQGLAGRAARALNRAWGRGGDVWGDRYHARALGTPREVRNGLLYVLLNFRKHLRAAPGIDPRSSAAWFDGWAHGAPPRTPPCPVAPARTGSARSAGAAPAAQSTGAIVRAEPSQIWRVSHCRPPGALHDMPKPWRFSARSSSRFSPWLRRRRH